MQNKIIVVVMGDNCSKFLDMCFNSIIEADKIIFCWGKEDKNTLIKFKKWKENNNKKVDYITNEYNQEDKAMNGKQRNFYLDYIKKNYPGWWCLAIDADEVVEGLNKIKDIIQTVPKNRIYSPKIRHLIGNLGHEDSTQTEHFVPHRLFYIDDGLYYPEVEHPVLNSKNINMQSRIKGATIWHLSHIAESFNVKQKYENHLKKSKIHTNEFLKQWYYAHLFGTYPTKQFNPIELPEVILKEFGIDKDELYFANRGLEAKHFLMAKEYLSLVKPSSVLDIGCGFGNYGKAIKTMVPLVNYIGVDKSKWAVENTPYKDLDIKQMDITKGIALPDSDYDLVLAVDILEHLDYKDLDRTLNLISQRGKHFIFSIPFKNEDENLYKDNTHKIFEEKGWWKEKFSKYFDLIETPKNWLYSHQILVGERKK